MTHFSYSSFVGVFNHCKASVCGQVSMGSGRACTCKWRKYWCNAIALSTFPCTRFLVQSCTWFKFRMQRFSYFLFSCVRHHVKYTKCAPIVNFPLYGIRKFFYQHPQQDNSNSWTAAAISDRIGVRSITCSCSCNILLSVKLHASVTLESFVLEGVFAKLFYMNNISRFEGTCWFTEFYVALKLFCFYLEFSPLYVLL